MTEVGNNPLLCSQCQEVLSDNGGCAYCSLKAPRYSTESRELLLERALMFVKAHLGACLIQQIDTDDKIIMDHIRDAHALAEQALKP